MHFHLVKHGLCMRWVLVSPCSWILTPHIAALGSGYPRSSWALLPESLRWVPSAAFGLSPALHLGSRGRLRSRVQSIVLLPLKLVPLALDRNKQSESDLLPRALCSSKLCAVTRYRHKHCFVCSELHISRQRIGIISSSLLLLPPTRSATDKMSYHYYEGPLYAPF